MMKIALRGKNLVFEKLEIWSVVLLLNDLSHVTWLNSRRRFKVRELTHAWIKLSFQLGASSFCWVKSRIHISYPTLKRVYEAHLTEARQLENPQTREEMQERGSGVWGVFFYISSVVRCSLTKRTDTSTWYILIVWRTYRRLGSGHGEGWP